jgi:predicted SAM-dependent methyltransferase
MRHLIRRLLLSVGALVFVLILVVWLFDIRSVKRQLRRSAAIAGLYDGVRADLESIRMPAFARRSPEAMREYVQTHVVRKLQIGAGDSRLVGWLNTDIERKEGLVYLDASQPFPLEDGSFHYVFSEHVIEHLSYDDGMKMLSESYRILAPGGKIRIATPNLLRLVALFDEQKSDAARNYMPGKLAVHGWPIHPRAEAFILNLELSSFGHRFVYDPDTLNSAMLKTGFRSIQEYRGGESDDPNLQGVEYRQNGAYIHLNDYETMIFQAVKP